MYPLTHLLLQGEDVRDAAVDRVAEPGLSLVGDGDGRLAPIADGKVHEELRHVAGPEHLVDRREVRRPLLVSKVRGKDTPPHTLPPQELARPARRTEPRHRCFATSLFS